MSESDGPSPGTEFNPQTGYPVPGGDQPGQPTPPPPAPQQPYGYAQNPYGQQPYAQQPYGQQPYGYGYPTYQRPDHPRATTSMVLGIVALAGGLLCYLPLFLGPFAWVISHRTRRAIRASPQQWDGDGKATAGLVTGIIATVILILGLIVLAIIIWVGVAEGWDTYEDDGTYAGTLLG